jgi:hypothetical protein
MASVTSPLAIALAACVAGVLLAGCAGSSHAPASLSYVAFGDSFAAWETLHGFGYTKSLKDGLATERKAVVLEKNFGHAGDYSGDMLAVLRQPASI